MGEAASIAGHFKLGKLTFVYDDNHITIEGKTELTFSDDVTRRFEGYHWHVQNLGEKANDIAAIEQALKETQSVTDRPSLIILRSHIGYGAPNKHDTKEAHGSPLGIEEVKAAKKFYGWDENKNFYVPEDVLTYMHRAIEAGQELEDRWNELFTQYKNKYPMEYEDFNNALNNKIPSDWDSDIPYFEVCNSKSGSKSSQQHRGQNPMADGRKRRPCSFD